jgi:hypothetical protein
MHISHTALDDALHQQVYCPRGHRHGGAPSSSIGEVTQVQQSVRQLCNRFLRIVSGRRLGAAALALATGIAGALLIASPAAASTSFTFNAGSVFQTRVTAGYLDPVLSGHTGAGTAAAETSTITTRAPFTVINVTGTNLAANDTLNFVFSDPTDVVFLVDFDTVTIAGQLNAFVGSLDGPRGGNVWFQGNDGVLFTGTARVDVGGLLATTHRTNSDGFIAGDYEFIDPFTYEAGVIIGSGATITGHGSLLAFLSPVMVQAASSVVGGAADSGTEVLYGSQGFASLRLGTRASGLELLGLDPRPLPRFGPGRGPDLAGTTRAPDVFVVGAASFDTENISVGGVVEATGAPAENSGDVVMSAGSALTRTTGDDPMQIGTTRDSHQTWITGSVTAPGRVLMSSSASILLQSSARLSAPDVVLAASSSVVNYAGQAGVDVGDDGRWLVYAGAPLSVQAPTGVTPLDSGNPAVWGTTMAETAPSTLTGNRYVFRQKPTITFTADDVSKPFGEVFSAFTSTASGDHLGKPGYFLADPAPAYTGAPAFASDGAAAAAPALRSGPYPITISQGSLSSPPGYGLAFANGRLTVTDSSPAAVVPVISGTLGEAGWYTSDVDLSWSITDAESFADPVECADVAITADQQETAYACSVTGPGGPGSGSATIKRDATGPTLGVDGLRGTTPYTSGSWTSGDVAVTYTCSDATSGVASQSAGTTATSTGDYDGTCTDTAGNTTTTPFRVNIDRTPPQVTDVAATAGGAAYTPGSWTRHDVTVTWTCTDAESGVVNATGSQTRSESTEFTPVCLDNVGHLASGDPVAIRIDTVAPVLATVPDQNLTTSGSSATASWTAPTATDLSPAAPAVTCDPPSGSSFAVGTTTVTCSATDAAGNVGSTTFTVTVTQASTGPSVTFAGPVDAPPVVNLSTPRRIVPIRVTLTTPPGTAAQRLYVGTLTRVNCQGATSFDRVESYASSRTAGNVFRWNAASGQWVYNLATSSLKTNTCYRVPVYYGGTVRGGTARGGTLIGYALLRPTR